MNNRKHLKVCCSDRKKNCFNPDVFVTLIPEFT